jgi:RimJ/RimL family protein N-acetyltransferase
MNLEPTDLLGEKAELVPLRRVHFEELYAVASDPLIWEQHPNPDRYKREVFTTFFDGAMEMEGAFLIRDAATGDAIGSSRFYDFDAGRSEVKIGYTFFARSCWGKGYNQEVKRMMLDHAFKYVDNAVFHVGVDNRRSRIAMERLGAENIGEVEVAYYGETPKRNVVYRISKPSRL